MTAYTFDQLITFTRTSAATYVGSNGLVAVTPASRNLLTYTQDFDNAAWSKTNASAYSFDPATATYGAELVTNGDFSAGSTGWTLGAGWAAGTGEVCSTSSGAGISQASLPAVAGRTYQVTFTITSYTAGAIRVEFGGVNGVSRNAPGTYTQLITAINANTFSLSPTSTITLCVDNISVKEVIGGLITAPDGTLTGDALVATAGTGITPLLNQTGTIVASTIYTASIFVRPGTHTFVQLYLVNQGADWCNFTLTGSGSVQNNGAAVGAISYDSATGWYRISMVYTAGGTDRRPGLAIVPSGTATRAQTGTYTGAESIYIWGAQLEAASAASTYTRNNGGVYPPRFDYDPVTRAPRGLLIEEQRTNLFTNSEFPNGLSDAPTRGGNVSTSTFSLLSGNTGLAINNTGAVTSFAYKGNFTTVSGTTYTLSAFVRMDDGGAPSFGSTVNAASQNSFALVVAGSAINPTTYTVTAMGNGFYRVSVVSTAGAASTNNGVVKYDTNDGRSFTVSGYQLEAGPFATSYIPTVASQVTRTADQAVITAPMFAPWYRQSEGTLVVQADSFASVDTSVRWAVSAADSSANSRNTVFLYNGRWGASARISGTDQCDLQQTGSYTPNTAAKIAFAYKANDFAASVNGLAALTDNSGSIPSVDRLFVGSLGATNALNGHIQSIDYYPTRLTNAQIQALTA